MLWSSETTEIQLQAVPAERSSQCGCTCNSHHHPVLQFQALSPVLQTGPTNNSATLCCRALILLCADSAGEWRTGSCSFLFFWCRTWEETAILKQPCVILCTSLCSDYFTFVFFHRMWQESTKRSGMHVSCRRAVFADIRCPRLQEKNSFARDVWSWNLETCGKYQSKHSASRFLEQLVFKQPDLCHVFFGKVFSVWVPLVSVSWSRYFSAPWSLSDLQKLKLFPADLEGPWACLDSQDCNCFHGFIVLWR